MNANLIIFVLTCLFMLFLGVDTVKAEKAQNENQDTSLLGSSLREKIQFSLNNVVSFVTEGVSNFCTSLGAQLESALSSPTTCSPTDAKCMVKWIKSTVTPVVKAFLQKTTGFVPPTVAQAKVAADKYAKEFPGWIVLAIDMFASKWSQTVIYQSAYTHADKSLGDFAVNIRKEEELYDIALIKYAIYAICSPNQDFGPSYAALDGICYARYLSNWEYILLVRIAVEKNATLCLS